MATFKTLTAKGERYEVGSDLQQMLAYLSDGRLIVAKSYQFNPHVTGFIGRLRHQGLNVDIERVELDEIKNFYESSDRKKSDMQAMAYRIFERAAKEFRASDIHIRVNESKATEILFRVNGHLTKADQKKFEEGDELCRAIYQTLADETSQPNFEPLSRQDARIGERDKLPSMLDGIRIATSPKVDGYLMVLRLLYNDTTSDTNLVNLGYTQHQADEIDMIKRRPSGIVIISGPTGSGKSTTLQRVLTAILDKSGNKINVITVEDPPEYPIPGAVQTPVIGAETEEERAREYQKAIKTAMRLDPDIIMISEIRDPPTAMLAIQGAQTGHPVYTTLHANSALAALNRMANLGALWADLTDPQVLSGLISQRLVQVLCPHCKIKLLDALNQFDKNDIERMMKVIDFETAYVTGPGCGECKNSGTTGRQAVAEVVRTDLKLMQLLKNQNMLGAYKYWLEKLGGMTIYEHTILKINQGLIDPFEAENSVGSLSDVVINLDSIDQLEID